MHQVELRYISHGGRTRSGRLVDVHHFAFLSGDDHCSIRNGAGSQRCDPCRSLRCVLVYEGGVICVLKLRRTDGVRTRADCHDRVHATSGDLAGKLSGFSTV